MPGASGEVVMLTIWAWLQSRLMTERGAGFAEYGLLAVLIAIVALIALEFTGTELSETYSEIASGIEWADN
jgi:Flp pilus assembly pilin Flp